MADTVDWERIKEYVEDDEVLNKKIDQLADLVSRARYVVFFTGAGVSTSAGVPDYRGPNGAWTMKYVLALHICFAYIHVSITELWERNLMARLICWTHNQRLAT